MYKRILTAGLGVSLVLGTAACDMDTLTDVNVNPNNPTVAPAPSLFVHGARLGTNRWLGNANLRMFSLIGQHVAEVQYPETDAYVRITAGFTETNFNNSYAEELKDFAEVIRLGQEQGAPGYYAPAMVMQSWGFGLITDMWGDVPYSQALRGDDAEAEGAVQPAYDPQSEIYDNLFANFDAATQALAGASGPTLGNADPIYGGNIAAWQRFSNSLRARHALRIVNVDAARAEQELAAAFNAPGGVFETNAHSAVVSWPGNGVYDNPWSTNFQTRDDHRVSDRLLAFLGGWDDPRLHVLAQPAERDTAQAALGNRATKYCDWGTPCYVGLANAMTHALSSPLVPYTSKPGERFYRPDNPSFIMTNAEVQFIRAEAAARGLGGLAAGQAAGFYEDAIRASMEQWGITDAAEIDAYLARPEVAYQDGTAGLEQIATQKWVALFGDGIQAWTEWRRTCQPANIRPGPDATLNEVPRRLQYATTESAVNEASLAAAVARQGPDQLTTRIWWDTGNAPTCG